MKLLILLLSICLLSCHSDYYSDGCKKGCYGAYIDGHGSPSYRKGIYYFKEANEALSLAWSVKYTDSAACSFFANQAERLMDSSKKYQSIKE